MKILNIALALLICIAVILPVSAFISDTENKGVLTLDLTPDMTTALKVAPEFQPIHVKVVKIEDKTEITIWESDINEQKDMNIPVPVGNYKLYVQLHGHRTIWELDNEGREYEVSLSNSTMVPAWANNIHGKEVFADGPWRVQSNEIPILIMVKDADGIYGDYDLGNVEIYLDKDCDEDNNEANDILLETVTKWHGVTVDESFYNLYNPGDWYGITYLDPLEYDLSGDICFHVIIRENGKYDPDWDSHSHFKIKVNPDNLPVLSGWHPGDIHYHSSYTDSKVEFGFPIEATLEAGKAIGLDWNAITDHSFDVRDSKTADPNHKWNALKNDIDAYTTNSYKLILGEEVSCYGHNINTKIVPPHRGVIHFLVLGMENFRDVTGTGIDFIPGGHDEMPEGGETLNIEDVINIVNSQGGVSYAAHPEGHLEFYNEILGRVPWITEDYDLIGYNGLQVWNQKKTQDDDWETQRDDGLKQWIRQLTEQERKDVFIAGGSDAHGDFSHTTTVKDNSDNAFGKVRTYVYTSTFSNDKILNALKNGNSIMTDGPLVIFDITNEHGKTAIIGDEITGRDFTLNIQWESTEEFGKVDWINIWKGILGEEGEQKIKTFSVNSFSGNEIYSINDKIPSGKTSYIRIEAGTQMRTDSDGNPEDYKAYTNPIWIEKKRS